MATISLKVILWGPEDALANPIQLPDGDPIPGIGQMYFAPHQDATLLLWAQGKAFIDVWTSDQNNERSYITHLKNPFDQISVNVLDGVGMELEDVSDGRQLVVNQITLFEFNGLQFMSIPLKSARAANADLAFLTLYGSSQIIASGNDAFHKYQGVGATSGSNRFCQKYRFRMVTHHTGWIFPPLA